MYRYIYIYLLYVGFVRRFANREIKDYDATLFLKRQHAEPLNMQPLFFCATASTVCPAEPWVRQRVGPGRSGESQVRVGGNNSHSGS